MSRSPYASNEAQSQAYRQTHTYVRVEFLMPKDVYNMMKDFARTHEVPGGMQEALRLLLIEGLAAIKRGEALATQKENGNA